MKRIVCAANRYDTCIVVGVRHFDPIMYSQILAYQDAGHILSDECCVQGFLDNTGMFLTRAEAWAVALAANQIIRRVGGDTADGGRLYSENMY